MLPELRVITGPSYEPITLAELQAQSRIDTSTEEENRLIEDIFIPAARDYLEWRTGRTCHQKTLEMVLPAFPASDVIELLGATPLIAVSSVKYTDKDGVETTWGASNYVVSTGSRDRLGRLAPAYGVTWPSFTPYPLDAVKIRYTAGIATASPVTEAQADVKYAMQLLVAKMWEYREAIVVADRATVSQIAVEYGLEAFISKLQVQYAF